MKTNILGVCAVVLLIGALLIARILHRPVLCLTLCVSAFVCSTVAGVRGPKGWLWVSMISGLLSAQAILAAFVE